MVDKHPAIASLTARWPSWLRAACGLVVLCLAGGCANVDYARTATGKLTGKLDVEWIAPNQFIYRPHQSDPLTYVTSNGQSIRPRAMFTDGGSIPRFFWAVPDFGPWDYAPGFIIHDWLFLQHYCREGDWESFTLERTADVLAEAIKTQMEKNQSPNEFAVWTIRRAVSSSAARKAWDNGQCTQPPPAAAVPGVPPAIRLMTIEVR
jgi:hypothetical protein